MEVFPQSWHFLNKSWYNTGIERYWIKLSRSYHGEKWNELHFQAYLKKAPPPKWYCKWYTFFTPLFSDHDKGVGGNSLFSLWFHQILAGCSYRSKMKDFKFLVDSVHVIITKFWPFWPRIPCFLWLSLIWSTILDPKAEHCNEKKWVKRTDRLYM